MFYLLSNDGPDVYNFLALESDERQSLNEKWREKSDLGEKGLWTRKNTLLDLSPNSLIGF